MDPMPEPAPAAATDAHPDPAEPWLTVAGAARRLGVAPATLRTWDRRYGIGPSEHTPGRHRRYSAADLARLELMQRALVRGAAPADAARWALAADRPEGSALTLTPVPAAEAGRRAGGGALRPAGAGAAARGLARAALALDAPAVSGLLAESLAGDGVEVAWDELVRPVLAAIADRWAHTGAGVEVEHLVSECVLAVFGAHRRAAPPAAAARPVLLAAMPGELHTLPIVALAAALAHRGVAHRYLGANLPADALIAAVRRTAPAAVVLWAQVGDTADTAVLAQLPPARPLARAFAAGPGWDATTLPPRAERLGSLRQAMAAIAGTVPA
jgi:hypothetical protein